MTLKFTFFNKELRILYASSSKTVSNLRERSKVLNPKMHPLGEIK